MRTILKIIFKSCLELFIRIKKQKCRTLRKLVYNSMPCAAKVPFLENKIIELDIVLFMHLIYTQALYIILQHGTRYVKVMATYFG